jgi:phospholipid/cholesterol/gamma-HCH transport system ATP-binding protein
MKTATETNDVIIIKDLFKAFDSNEVLKGINLNLAKGESLVVIGKSGSGKSVLIKCLIGLIDKDKGNISILNNDIDLLSGNELNLLRKKIGFLFQSAALYDSMNVEQNLNFHLRGLKDLSPADAESMIHKALENVGLLDALTLMPSSLSGGMRKRIGFARAMILNPEIMLYDEPTTGLDAITSREISNLIVDTQKKYQTSSIIITHDLQCAKICGNRLMVIHEGEFIASGTYEELQKSENKIVNAFFQ